MINPKKLEYKNKIAELLSLRYSLKYQMSKVNKAIEDGLKNYLKDFPHDWYVVNPKENIIKYLENKYNKELKTIKDMDYGYGERNEKLFICPHDADFSFEITQEEFDLIIESKNYNNISHNKSEKT